jgi:hypothetical protein
MNPVVFQRLGDLNTTRSALRPPVADSIHARFWPPLRMQTIRQPTLNAAQVLPDHSAPGDGSMVAAEKSLLTQIRTRALALKRQGVTVDDAGKQVTAELKAAHPDWPNTNGSGLRKKRVRRRAVTQRVWSSGSTRMARTVERNVKPFGLGSDRCG